MYQDNLSVRLLAKVNEQNFADALQNKSLPEAELGIFAELSKY